MWRGKRQRYSGIFKISLSSFLQIRCSFYETFPSFSPLQWHLLSYKTCLDTKPVLYQDRFCSLIDVIMGAMAFQITSLTIVYLTVYSGADQRKYQNSASLAFVRGIHRWPVNSPHKWPVTRKMFPFDDVIMQFLNPNISDISDYIISFACIYINDWINKWRYSGIYYCYILYTVYPLGMFVAFYTEIS